MLMNFARMAMMRMKVTQGTGRKIHQKAAPPLNVVMILGSTRTNGPPHPAPLGKRVSLFLQTELSSRGHEVTVIDPLALNLELMRKPHFAYAPSKIPSQLGEIAEKLISADAFVMCTPEYNHSPSPALLNVLNHFGSSLFSFKPSCIVSYSAGQWGGTRAAHALRPVLSELGCIAVSSMIHIPRAQEVLDEAGSVVLATGQERDKDPDYTKWSRYAGRTFSQLEWWGGAAKAHRKVINPLISSPAFLSDPSQRNAP